MRDHVPRQYNAPSGSRKAQRPGLPSGLCAAYLYSLFGRRIMAFGENDDYIAACLNGDCPIVTFWIGRIDGVNCPWCAEIGSTNVGTTITSAGRPEQAVTGEDPQGRSGQREVTSGSGILHEGVSGRERLRDHDGQEKG